MTATTLGALIEKAMRERAPVLLMELLEGGRSPEFLANSSAEMLEVFEELDTPDLEKLPRSDGGALTGQRWATEIQRRMWEQALNVGLPAATTSVCPP